MDFLKSRRIVKKKLLIEAIDKDIADIEHFHKILTKSLAEVKGIPKVRFLFCYGEQELQENDFKGRRVAGNGEAF